MGIFFLSILETLLFVMQTFPQTYGSVCGILKEKGTEIPTAHGVVEFSGNYEYHRIQRDEHAEPSTENRGGTETDSYRRGRWATAKENMWDDATDSTNMFSTCTVNDTTFMKRSKAKSNSPYKFRPAQLIVPAALIGVGAIGLESDWLKHQNHEIREELQENIDHKLTFDDFSQYAPIATIYGLDLFGVRGKHYVIDQTIILGTAYALMGASVISLKTLTKVERPDCSSRNSFPSGHTATAFMGAELLRREYWDVSPWIGIAGYAVAAGTGFFRMYNNRHWFTDVIAGAGIGILSVNAAYWLYPAITKTFFHKRFLKNVYLAPYASSQEKGLTCRIVF